MVETADNDVKDGVLVLPSRMDTQMAEDLLKTLLERRAADLTLDISAVEMLGARCLEVLLNARHTWASANKTLSLSGSSEALSENLKRYGLKTSDLETGVTP